MATPTTTITTPLAQNQTCQATLPMPWHVQQTEYDPRKATFAPLVNGEEAFGAIYDAILNAQHTVDIICWGFQPSMYFKRGSNVAGATIGELLAAKGADGKRVRLLVWQDDLHFAEWGENNAPGNNAATVIKPHIWDWVYSLPVARDYIAKDYQAGFEREKDLAWYARANLNNVTKRNKKVEISKEAAKPLILQAYDAASYIKDRVSPPQPFKGIEFATRDFSIDNRDEIAYRVKLHNATAKGGADSGSVSVSSMKIFPTHHQKMVLIDYEYPDVAVGFVMGHNMLDTYWDTSDHSYLRMHPQMGRNGLHPRQDISSRVSGPILKDLNDNFCQAWDEATGQSLTQARAAAGGKLALHCGSDTPVMAQVLRTQSQHDKRDIKTLYMQAVNNSTQFIYIENQYFRYPELAARIKDTAAKQYAGGRSPAEHGSLYLFVVTNSSDEGIGPGTVNTYKMLDSLGSAGSIPEVARAERADALNSELATAQKNAAPVQGSMSIQEAYSYAQYHQDAQAELEAVQRKIQENKNSSPQAVTIPGLKVHVCTLVAPDSPPGGWDYVYVHAKLMIVDDAFTTLGSANINFRSMDVDSELNICHEHGEASHSLRKKLWTIHTKPSPSERLAGDSGTAGASAAASGDNISDAFDAWGQLIDKNKIRMGSKKKPPLASLVAFRTDTTKRTTVD